MDQKRHVHKAQKAPQNGEGKPAAKPRVLSKEEVKTAKAALVAAENPAPKKNKPGGRPSVLTPQLAINIFSLSRKGLTDKEIAAVYFVNESTITNWKKSPEFFTSLKEAKSEADGIVERSLFERATGYEHPEEKLFVIDSLVVSKTIMKHYPPDPTAMIFWLKNRNPDSWREKIPELANIADAMGSVLQQLRKHQEKPAKNAKKN